jgi:hypothetical protein
MHGSHGALDRAVPADHEHRNRLAPDPQRLDELDAVDAGHAQIEQHQVVGVRAEREHGGARIGCDVHLVPVSPEQGRRREPKRMVVVDDEEASHPESR